MNECLVPLDMDWKDNIIIDNEINDNLIKLVPAGCLLTCVFDCCHSGTMSGMMPSSGVGSWSGA